MRFVISSTVLLITTAFLITACLIQPGNAKQKNLSRTAQSILSKGQILLRNRFEFSGNRKSFGASAFIVGTAQKHYAVTAKHLLGSAMGISPAVPPTKFDSLLKHWQFLMPASYQPFGTAKNILEPDDNLDIDYIKITIRLDPNAAKTHSLQSLSIAKKRPLKGQAYYLIGCPYADDSCTQNIYKLTYSGNDSNGYYLFNRHDKSFSLAGFSGAPIVTKNREVIAVLSGTYGNRVRTQPFR